MRPSIAIGALALVGAVSAAAVSKTTITSSITKTVTLTSTSKQTEYSTVTKTVAETTVSTTTKTKTAISTLSPSTIPASTVTAPASTVTSTVTATSTEIDVSTLAASTVTMTETAPASTSTVTQTASTVTVTQLAPASTSTVTQSASTVTLTQAASTVTATTCVATTTKPTTTTSTSATTTNTFPTTTETALQANPTMGLNDYAKAVGLYLGSAMDIPGTGEYADPIYMAVANNDHEFGQRTPANIMKYEYTEPSQGVFNFTGGDFFIQAAQQAGQDIIRCHNLVWYNQLPYWLTSGTWTSAQLIEIMENHITQLVSHFGSACYCWDVVNEAFNDDGTWRQDIWYNTIGPSYVSLAFSAAEAAVKANNLTTKLYYNDYNIETPGAKTTSAQNLVRNLTAAGIQIDGVGLQSHFIINETPYVTTQKSNLASFVALGVEVAITELDVRAPSLPVTAAQQTEQFNAYKWTVGACATTPGCVGITLWDFDDTYSWIPSTFPGQGWGCPWFLPQGGSALVKKIAYDGIIDGFDNGNNY